MISVEAWRAQVGSFCHPWPREKFKAPVIKVNGHVLRLCIWITILLTVNMQCDQCGQAVDTRLGGSDLAPVYVNMTDSPGLWSHCENGYTMHTSTGYFPGTSICWHTSATRWILMCCGDIESNPGPGSAQAQGSRVTRQGSVSTPDGNLGFADIMRELKETRIQVNDKIDALGERMEAKYQVLEENIDLLKQELSETKKERDNMRHKIDDLENRSRRNNIIFHGVSETEHEDCELKLCDTINEKLELSVDAGNFERVHRLGRPNRNGRPLIALCSSYKIKMQILKAVKDTKPAGFFVNEDYSEPVRHARKILNDMKKTKRELGYSAFLVYNKLVVKNDARKENVYILEEGTQKVEQIRRSFDDTIEMRRDQDHPRDHGPLE